MCKSDNSEVVEVVRAETDPYGTPTKATYRLVGAEDGMIKLGKVDPFGYPPKPEYTPEEFVAEGFHLKAECPLFDEEGTPLHLRDDFDGDFDSLPDCPKCER